MYFGSLVCHKMSRGVGNETPLELWCISRFLRNECMSTQAGKVGFWNSRIVRATEGIKHQSEHQEL